MGALAMVWPDFSGGLNELDLILHLGEGLTWLGTGMGCISCHRVEVCRPALLQFRLSQVGDNSDLFGLIVWLEDGAKLGGYLL